MCPNFIEIGYRLPSSNQRHISTIFNQHTWRHSPWCPRHEPGSSSDWSRWRGWSPHGREWETVHNTVPHCRAVTQVRRREELRCYMLANQSLDLFCLNQPEISNVFEPIRDQYCLVSTNQRLVLFSVNQSEISIDLWQPIKSEWVLPEMKHEEWRWVWTVCRWSWSLEEPPEMILSWRESTLPRHQRNNPNPDSRPKNYKFNWN